MLKPEQRSPNRRCALGLRAAAAIVLAGLSSAVSAAPPEFAPAVAAAERGEFAACASAFESIAVAASQDGLARRALYGGAVCATQGKDLDRAFALLERAIGRGFHDDDRFYFDPRLQPLRTDRRWPTLEARFVSTRNAWRASLDPELATLAREDQQDRRPGVGGLDWEYIAPRDRERVRRVREIVAKGGARNPDDLYHAALILQRGDEVADLELAHNLARLAAEADADLSGARRLAAASLDRALVRSGKPQRYGTQMIYADGRWAVAEVDPAVTDAERAAWDVAPLAESRQRAEEMNAAGEVPSPDSAKPVVDSPPPAEPPATKPADEPPPAPPASRRS